MTQRAEVGNERGNKRGNKRGTLVMRPAKEDT
jgi:hypothetical protein